MKKFEKISSLVIAIIMVLQLSAVTFANENNVKNIENGIEYLTVYNKANQTVQAIQHYIEKDEFVYGPVIQVDSMSPNSVQLKSSLRSWGPNVHQDTFLNFEYDIWYRSGSKDEWSLQRPSSVFSQNYFKVYENNSNRDLLNNWKRDVDALNAQEWAVIGGVGLSIFNIVKAAIISHAAVATGGTLTAAAIDSIKDSAVAAGGTAIGIGFLCTTYNNCARSYRVIYNNTDNIHY